MVLIVQASSLHKFHRINNAFSFSLAINGKIESRIPPCNKNYNYVLEIYGLIIHNASSAVHSEPQALAISVITPLSNTTST